MQTKKQLKTVGDKILIKRAKKEPHKFEALYRKYADDIFNYFWYRVNHNREVAEDLMQETFVRAFEHLPKFRERGYSYKTYLLSIAKNLWVNYLKKRKPSISLDELTDLPAEALQESKLDDKLMAENLWRAVQRLPQTEKDALLMRYREELKVKEMAKIMQKTPNAVKIILSRARQKLKAEFDVREMSYFADARRKYVKPKFLKKVK